MLENIHHKISKHSSYMSQHKGLQNYSYSIL